MHIRYWKRRTADRADTSPAAVASTRTCRRLIQTIAAAFVLSFKVVFILVTRAKTEPRSPVGRQTKGAQPVEYTNIRTVDLATHCDINTVAVCNVRFAGWELYAYLRLFKDETRTGHALTLLGSSQLAVYSSSYYYGHTRTAGAACGHYGAEAVDTGGFLGGPLWTSERRR